MVNLSFPLPKNTVECEINIPSGAKIVDVESNIDNVIRVYAEAESASTPCTEKHKIIVLMTGVEIDITGYELKRIGHVKLRNDYVCHVYECLN